MVLDEPARPHPAPDLLVCGCEEDHVAFQRNGGALEREQGHQLRDSLAFHVERPAPPDVPVLLGAAEGIHLPVLRTGEHDVHVVEQDQRARASVAPQARVEVGFPGPGLEDLRLDSLAGEYGLQPGRGLELVPRRVGGVDRDVL